MVATVNGQKVTAQQALKLLQAMPQAELQRFQQAGGGLPTALQQIFLMQHLSDLALQQHLDQQEPWKTELQFSQANTLAQAYVNQLSSQINPSAADVKSYYDQHPQQFQDAELSGIIVNFTPASTTAPPNTPGARTEAQAKVKADDLVKKIRGGANFTDLAKTESDHKASAAKGGLLGSFSPDKLPKEISDPVFKLEDRRCDRPHPGSKRILHPEARQHSEENVREGANRDCGSAQERSSAKDARSAEPSIPDSSARQ